MADPRNTAYYDQTLVGQMHAKLLAKMAETGVTFKPSTPCPVPQASRGRLCRSHGIGRPDLMNVTPVQPKVAAPRAFHVLLKPRGAICNLDCKSLLLPLEGTVVSRQPLPHVRCAA